VVIFRKELHVTPVPGTHSFVCTLLLRVYNVTVAERHFLVVRFGFAFSNWTCVPQKAVVCVLCPHDDVHVGDAIELLGPYDEASGHDILAM
jgi:hypothetical protein